MLPNIFAAYKDFVSEGDDFGYTNTIFDKFNFLKMYFQGEYNYLNDPIEIIPEFDTLEDCINWIEKNQ